MNAAAVRHLVVKELQQLRRAKRALFTAVFMPILFLVVFPVQYLVVFRAPQAGTARIEPAVIQMDTRNETAFVCAVVQVPGGAPRANTLVEFRVGSDTFGGAATDATGRACAQLRMDLLPGTYQVTPVTPFLRGPLQTRDARLVISGPPPAAYTILAPTTSTSASSPNVLNDLALRFLVPFFIFIAGAIVPTAFAAQTVLLERERRSLDLLLALPVTVSEVLTSKVAFTLLVSLAVLVPLFFVDAGLIISTGKADPAYLLSTALLLVASAAASSLATLVMVLLTREMRTASNLTGLASLPAMGVVAALLFLVPSPGSMLLASALMIGLGSFAYWAATRWITFERYLE